MKGDVSLSQTTATIVGIYQINLISANKIKENYERYIDSNGLPFANTYRLGIFYVLARTNGIWDLKQTLGEETIYRFKGTQKTGEYIGNHHYGYMGKAIGLSSTVLRAAAGMYQIYSGTSKWRFVLSYFDDPLDSKAIADGCNDYDDGYRF
ncbi:polymorphic toxin type 44 domain-containing protein [Bacillus songklensis]|uniref:Polymorphic toxin type 44 domain-containing protein n=1 Tax=Bacillus songklensis TaxID=1069116 RepID=A0ABV8AZR2_9BACI